MKTVLSTLMICFALFTQAQIMNNTNTMDKKYVEVTGVAEMEVIPNEIYVNITLQEEKVGMKRSVEEQEEILIKKLKKINVDIADLKLANVGSFTRWDKKTKESFKQKAFELKLTDAGLASQVMYELNSLEIYQMYVGKTDHSNIEKFRKQVKIDAVKAAKAKAGYLLEAVNESIGDVIFIVEQDNNYYGGYRSMGVANVAYAESSYNPSPEVEFQPITIKYKILARFEIK